MLSLHLQKSHTILRGRLQFIRCRLLGQPIPRASRLRRQEYTQRAFLTKASTLAKKYTAQPAVTILSAQEKTEKQVVKEPFRFPEVHRQKKETVEQSFIPDTRYSKVVVRKTKPVRQVIFSVMMALSFTILILLFAPVVYFRFFSHEVVPVQTEQVGTPLGGEFAEPVQNERRIELPPRNENLPEGNWLTIPRIGVRTEVLESEVAEESLVKGVWRVPDFATPGDFSQPMILAAHRYGYNWWWKGEYWKYNSFYLLPDLEPGDLVEVISDKRKYVYEIYAGEEGTEITDYNADLILYTCKFLTSDIRHFRYARLIDPSKYAEYGITN